MDAVDHAEATTPQGRRELKEGIRRAFAMSMAQRGLTPKEVAFRYLQSRVAGENDVLKPKKEELEEVIDASMTERQYGLVMEQLGKEKGRFQKRLDEFLEARSARDER